MCFGVVVWWIVWVWAWLPCCCLVIARFGWVCCVGGRGDGFASCGSDLVLV